LLAARALEQRASAQLVSGTRQSSGQIERADHRPMQALELASAPDLPRSCVAVLASQNAQPWCSQASTRWRALRESNPCFRRERAASWAARRRALGARTYRDVRPVRQESDSRTQLGWPTPKLEDDPCQTSHVHRALTISLHSALRAKVPWAKAAHPSAGARWSACRASARKPWCRRAEAG
jgi:hypothetical protein